METVVIEYHPSAYEPIEAAVVAAISAGAERVVLDLAQLESLDSAGVRGLIGLLRRARTAGGELALRSSRPEVLRTLQVTALDRLFHVMETEAA